jgi:hypothetical protein
MDDHQEWSFANPRLAALSTYSSLSIETCSFQQNLDSFSIAVVVLHAKMNRLADLKPLVPALLAAIASASPGAPKLIGID